MRNVLLIWPSFDIPNINFVPIGFGYIISNMTSKYNVEIKDFVLDKYSDEALAQLMEEFNPLAIGISFWEINYRMTKHLVKKIKKFDPNGLIILGGPSASSRVNSGLKEIGADFAIKGEGEKSFETLLDLISSGDMDDHGKLDKIPGLTYFNKKEDIYKSIPIKPIDLKDIKWPNYEKIRAKDYLDRDYNYGYFSKRVKNLPVIITRGCPYQCEFCSAKEMHGSKIRKRTLESLLEEVEYLYKDYSIRGINIVDDNFTFDKDFVIEFCETIISSKAKMPDLIFATPNGICMKTLDERVGEHHHSSGKRKR